MSDDSSRGPEGAVPEEGAEAPAEDSGRPFASVEEGPAASDDGPEPVRKERSDPEGHPSIAALIERFGDGVVHHEVNSGDQHVVFLAPERSYEMLEWLRDDDGQRYDLLADLTAVDYGGGRPLQVVYQLFSIPHQQRLRVKCELPLTDLQIRSVFGIWKAANWLEREVYDLFGIEFEGHPDLRRILMPENYAEGHPLRKDFPLRGRFTRAEQTRRALSQQVEDYYIPSELEGEREPQLVPWSRTELPGTPPPAAEAGDESTPEKE